MSNVVLTATGLRRVFGRRNEVVAVDGVNLDVEPGQIHALLGPNGAGKATTVRMCSTLLAPTSGGIAVDGVDAVRRPRRARARLGLVLGGELGLPPGDREGEPLVLRRPPGARRIAAPGGG
ncbi:ATP-binding cassette domain-containing protein [Actinomyces gerencseriae]|uniref:ATP-binding cassette domain-containing protein n=1 Tax=Actinomyces gerencseriae TaxID=52769 RepID=UPI0023F4A6C9|nr:ATP-binding cassette domain-containing protein [Actinomyces gerencseriae]